MSTLIKFLEWSGPRDEDLTFTQFAGPVNKGRCLQISQEDRFIQLTLDDIPEVVVILAEWYAKQRSAK